MNMQQGNTEGGDEIRYDGNEIEMKGPRKKRGRNKKTIKTKGVRQM